MWKGNQHVHHPVMHCDNFLLELELTIGDMTTIMMCTIQPLRDNVFFRVLYYESIMIYIVLSWCGLSSWTCRINAAIVFWVSRAVATPIWSNSVVSLGTVGVQMYSKCSYGAINSEISCQSCLTVTSICNNHIEALRISRLRQVNRILL